MFLLASKAKGLGTWVSIRVQIESNWQNAVQEDEGMGFFDEFKDAPDRMMELCNLKGVTYDVMEEVETIKQLFNKLKEETNNFKNNPGTAFQPARDIVLKPIIER